MFKHTGETRTIQHNLRIASLLSFVAGVVNVAGFLAVARLTTNVTGHFAYFVDEVFKFNAWAGFIYFMYIFFFFLGSFVSNFLVEFIHKKNGHYIYVIPVIIESLILFAVAVFGKILTLEYPDVLAFLLLFAMGVQNSLVTSISNATVRTTHLTGLFTDLGIELSQLFFYRQKEQRTKLYSSIRLRLTIISFFFLGGVTGGLLYSEITLYVLALAGMLLLLAIVFDYLQIRIFLNKKNKVI